MEEEREFKDQELDRIFDKIATGSYTLAKQEMIKIIGGGGGTGSPGSKLENFCTTSTVDGINYIEFHGDYKDKIRSMPEFKEFVDYLDRNNYHWI